MSAHTPWIAKVEFCARCGHSLRTHTPLGICVATADAKSCKPCGQAKPTAKAEGR